MKESMESDQETGAIVLCAIRYAIGRQSYMPLLVANWVKRHWQSISINDRHSIKHDLEEAFSWEVPASVGSSLGWPCDRQVWADLLQFATHHLDDPATPGLTPTSTPKPVPEQVIISRAIYEELLNAGNRLSESLPDAEDQSARKAWITARDMTEYVVRFK